MERLGYWSLLICALSMTSALGCFEGKKSPIDGSCKTYQVCENGAMVTKECSMFHLFDPTTLQCELSYKVKCQDKAKDCEDGKVYANPDSCRLYYTCAGGRLQLQFCPLLQIFDVSKGECKFGWSCGKTECAGSESRGVGGDCRAYQQCSAGAWKDESCLIGYNYNPATQNCEMGACKQCAHGEKAAGVACNKYQTCDRGVWTEVTCGYFKRYDPSKKNCVWWFQYTCPSSLNVMLLVGSPEVTQSCQTGDIRAERICSQYSYCDKGDWKLDNCLDGYIFDTDYKRCQKCDSCNTKEPDQESCRDYWSCKDGLRVKESCGYLRNFDAVTKECVFFNAHCTPKEKCKFGKRGTTDCKSYEECIGGHYYKKSCGLSKVYDTKTQDCIWTWPWRKCESSFECNHGDTKPLSCYEYVKCTNGFWESDASSCKSGQIFNGGKCLHGECNIKVKDCQNYSLNGVKMRCVEGEIFDEATSRCVEGTCRKKSKREAKCQKSDRQADGKDCRKYQECIDGEWTDKACSECQNFHPTQKKCVFVWEYPCEWPKTTTPTPTSPTTAPTSPTTAPNTAPTSPTTAPNTAPTSPTTAPTPPAEGCKDGKKKPDKANCRNFYICQNGKYVQDSCVWPRKFDSKELTCKWYGAVCA